MHRLRLMGSLGALVLAASPLQAQGPALTEKDKAAIRASTEAFTKEMVAGNFAGVAALYAENATVMPPNQPQVSGRAAIEAFLKSFPKVTAFSFELPEVDGRADLAYARGVYKMTMMPAGAPGPVTDTGKYVEVRRRQKDGSWKIAVDIFNSDLPPPK